MDAEGNFIIIHGKNSFVFRMGIYMHKDNTMMLKYIAQRLGVGRVVEEGERFIHYVVSSRSDVKKFLDILDKYPGFALNTTKNFNFIMWKKGYELYYNRTSINISPQLIHQIIQLKDQMNKQRVDFKQPEDHQIKITPY